MTHREVARAHFPNLASTLLADRTVVALTPASQDAAWTAGVCWDIARAVARSGRRVLLVDLHLEQSVLETGATGPADEGLVDAFVFGVSLTHVARLQEPELYYIGVGTAPPNPVDVWSSERWKRLARGFGSEGALMLLCTPPAALVRLGVRPDGLIVVAPNGFQPDSLTFPGIASTLAGGTPLVAVVREAPPPPPGRRDSGATRRRDSAGSRAVGFQPTRRSGVPPYATVGAAAVAILAVVLLLRAADSGESAPINATAAAPTQGLAVPPPQPPAPVPEGDSLFYSVQVAAFNTMGQAIEHAKTYDDAAGAATVSPVRLGRQGVWHRVLVGAVPTALAADSLLRRLWQRGRLERPNGTILRTPHAYEIARMSTPNAARDSASGLRDRGVAAYIVAAPDGRSRLLAGAFEGPEQAAVADSLLRLAGLRATLIQRAGIRP